MPLAKVIWVVLLFCWGIIALDRGSVTISNATDANVVRQGCRVISGNLTINLTYANDLIQLISLDGVESIRASLIGDTCSSDPSSTGQVCPNIVPYNISSSILTTIQVNVEFGETWFSGLLNLTLPNPTTVGGIFDINSWTSNIFYLDITSLTTVGSFNLEGNEINNLTFLHNELRNITGCNSQQGQLSVGGLMLDSVDSLFKNPLNVSYAQFWNLPNVNQVTFGLASAGSAFEGGANLTIIFDNPSTSSMKFGNFTLNGGVTNITGSAQLNSLTTGWFTTQNGNFLTRLVLPFDDLQTLSIFNEPRIEQVVLPRQAIGYDSFDLLIGLCPLLNLTSEYGVLDNGETGQTWYWPQKNMSSIEIFGNVETPFLNVHSNAAINSFLAYENETSMSDWPRVIDKFVIIPTSKADFDCTPFQKLHKEGILPTTDVYTYGGRLAARSGYCLHIPSFWGLFIAMLGTLSWVKLIL